MCHNHMGLLKLKLITIKNTNFSLTMFHKLNGYIWLLVYVLGSTARTTHIMAESSTGWARLSAPWGQGHCLLTTEHPASIVPRTLRTGTQKHFLNIMNENISKYFTKYLAHRRCKINALSLSYYLWSLNYPWDMDHEQLLSRLYYKRTSYFLFFLSFLVFFFFRK